MLELSIWKLLEYFLISIIVGLSFSYFLIAWHEKSDFDISLPFRIFYIDKIFSFVWFIFAWIIFFLSIKTIDIKDLVKK